MSVPETSASLKCNTPARAKPGGGVVQSPLSWCYCAVMFTVAGLDTMCPFDTV